nr:hypothetical protein [uncultured Dyadobacter sp.]
MTAIPTYIINLTERPDRRAHAQEQFESRAEFDCVLVDAERHRIGAVGLWNTIRKIIIEACDRDNDYILICEDDHFFTDHYSKELLFECIEEARLAGADILLGGLSSVHSLFKASRNLIWVEGFTGAQFTIIFSKFFKQILEIEFLDSDSADLKLSQVSTHIYSVYPFISVQKDFGYSDVTLANHIERRVDKLFADCSNAIQYVLDSQNFYGFNANPANLHFDDIVIPVYIINLPERTDRREHIERQFIDKKEFTPEYINASRHSIGAVGLWQSIRRIIAAALETDESVIIICEDDHEFTPDYHRDLLIGNIISAHRQGCDVLSAGTSGGFGHALPLDTHRYWVNHFLSTQFIVIYRKFFQRILDAPFDDTVTADNFLSQLTSNKMVIYPFLSTQKDFGYSDVTAVHNQQEGLVSGMFAAAARRLEKIRRQHDRFLSHQPLPASPD